MKQSSLGTKFFMVILTLGVLTYFGIQGYRYFNDPLTTTAAYAYEVEEGVDLSGYVVRREQVLEDDTGGLLRLQRSEGERVSAGGNVAMVYADQASLDLQNEIQSLESRIEQLQYAQAASLDVLQLSTVMVTRSILSTCLEPVSSTVTNSAGMAWGTLPLTGTPAWGTPLTGGGVSAVVR